MYDLEHFTLRDMTLCSSALRTIGLGASSMEEVADKIVRHLYDHLIDRPSGARSCALVRFYKTHPFGELEADLQDFARRLLGGHPESAAMNCLTLLASAGDKPEWNSRTQSSGHRAIPLPSEKVVTQFPMVSQLVRQFGLAVSAVLKPDPALLMDATQATYNVFYVPEAAGSPYIPAQDDFVRPLDIKSALGFGGVLPPGSLYAVILFSKVAIARETADMFKTLALSVKIAVLPFAGGAVFAPRAAAAAGPGGSR